MYKRFFTLLIFLTGMVASGSAQTAPVLLSSSYSVGTDYVLLTIKYIPHDTGAIDAWVVMQQGTGTSVYDSTYSMESHAVLDTDSATLYIGPLPLCGGYTLLLTMSNDSMQGLQYNPLCSPTIVCSGIYQVTADNFKLATGPHLLEIESRQLPPNGVAEVYDVNGRQIARANLNQPVQGIEMNAANGIYLLRIMSEGRSVYTSKFGMF